MPILTLSACPLQGTSWNLVTNILGSIIIVIIIVFGWKWQRTQSKTSLTRSVWMLCWLMPTPSQCNLSITPNPLACIVCIVHCRCLERVVDHLSAAVDSLLGYTEMDEKWLGCRFRLSTHSLPLRAPCSPQTAFVSFVYSSDCTGFFLLCVICLCNINKNTILSLYVFICFALLFVISFFLDFFSILPAIYLRYSCIAVIYVSQSTDPISSLEDRNRESVPELSVHFQYTANFHTKSYCLANLIGWWWITV